MTSGIKPHLPRITVCQGTSTSLDVETAIGEIFSQCNQTDPSLTLVYFADSYDHKKLCQALAHLPGPVVGCSSAGQLTSRGFQSNGISGLRFSSQYFQAVPYLIHPLDNIADQIEIIAADVQDRLHYSKMQAFGLLFVDGLAAREEALTASLYRALGDVPIVGGSAGDKLRFEKTHVYHGGQLVQNGAVFTLCMTSLPFTVFKHQHFTPTEKRLVITEAEPEKRLVHEINGEVAIKAYASLIGVAETELNASVFSRYPLMLRIGQDYFVRSIAGVEADGSLKFYCAIDTGLVLTIGEGQSAVESLEQSFNAVKEEIGAPVIIFGCDCILRRLEMEKRGVDREIGQLMAKNRVFGFSTYGEQYNSLHVNQTFTGVALGE